MEVVIPSIFCYSTIVDQMIYQTFSSVPLSLIENDNNSLLKNAFHDIYLYLSIKVNKSSVYSVDLRSLYSEIQICSRGQIFIEPRARNMGLYMMTLYICTEFRIHIIGITPYVFLS